MLYATHFYNLYHWHTDVKIADIGNIKPGASLEDTYSALQQVLSELSALNKKVVIIGGSHDINDGAIQSICSTTKSYRSHMR